MDELVYVFLPGNRAPVPCMPSTEKICVELKPEWIFFFYTEDEI